MAVAITAVTKRLDQIEAAQKDIIEFLQLKEKAKLRGILPFYKKSYTNTNIIGITINIRTTSIFKFGKSSVMLNRA